MPPEKWVDYQDGSLESVERAAIDAHIQDCTNCWNFVRSYSAIPRMAREALWTDVPDGCEGRLLRYLRDRGVPS